MAALPLTGIRVVEFAGLGPAPFAAMMLADFGAEVLRIARPGDPAWSAGIVERGRPSLELDLKAEAGHRQAADLVRAADVLIEGFRPGVMERLGLGPEECSKENPRLVYARMTGWGQDGPLASAAGHDINYLALTGTLFSLARRGEAPMPPLNLVGDYGGGGMLLAFGVLLALLEREHSDQGQVVDAAMLDGTNLLMAGIWSRVARGGWSPVPGTNDIDTGAPYYNVYGTADGRHMAVGAVEAEFYARVLAVLGVDPGLAESQHDRAHWPEAREALAERFRAEPMEHWIRAFGSVDACVSPVLTLEEARTDPQVTARGLLPTVDGTVNPAPAPRLLRTPARDLTAAVPDARSVLERWTTGAGEGPARSAPAR
ncbi:CaiB/BaiF CoA transferase family protein [Nonomuraea lactucae]|uniref:CaiB/BaiF CoA transferase family protein n=1 Tax=Nonomuraea lactucae TaxID=2249762 RepID=UPI000DE4C99F|nr:CaiB/BaiF CoA-transferase family protein [Nonomuraea lactucae]